MRRTRAGCAVVAILVGGSAVLAGPLTTEVGGMPAFTGTAAFNASDHLLVNVDYTVFAPGDYPGGAGPFGDDEYVYAYQAFNVSEAQALTTITIGLLENSGAGPFSIDLELGLPGGVPPSLTNLLDTSTIARFLAPQVLAGEHSTVLVYPSVNPPTFTAASVAGGGYSAQSSLPSPIPEPAAGVIAGLGVFVVFSGERSRRRGVWR